MAISNSEHVKKQMLAMIQKMDLNIVDFRVEERENDWIEVFTKHIVDDYETELNLVCGQREEGEQTEPLYFGGFKKYIEENPIYREMVLIEIEP